MPSRAEVERWVEGYRQAWEKRDPTAAGALFSADARYRSNIFEEPHEGRQGIEAYWSDVTTAQSDVTVHMGSPVIEGLRVVVEFWTTMLAGGTPLTLPGCLILDFDGDGLCTNLREYWHTLGERRDPFPGWGE